MWKEKLREGDVQDLNQSQLVEELQSQVLGLADSKAWPPFHWPMMPFMKTLKHRPLYRIRSYIWSARTEWCFLLAKVVVSTLRPWKIRVESNMSPYYAKVDSQSMVLKTERVKTSDPKSRNFYGELTQWRKEIPSRENVKVWGRKDVGIGRNWYDVTFGTKKEQRGEGIYVNMHRIFLEVSGSNTGCRHRGAPTAGQLRRKGLFTIYYRVCFEFYRVKKKLRMENK